MKQESQTAMKSDTKSSNVSNSTTPSRIRVSSNPKSSTVKQETANGNNNIQKPTRRSLFLNRPKSAEDDFIVGSQEGSRIEESKTVRRSVNRPVVEQFSRPTRRITDPKKKTECDLISKNKELQEKIDSDGGLIISLQSQISELKAELNKAQRLNIELESTNKNLLEELASAKANITAVPPRFQKDAVLEYQSPRFKEIQKLIASKLEQSTGKKEIIKESNTIRTPPTKIVQPVLSSATDLHKIVAPFSTGPPPPPPPPPSRPLVRAATARKAPPVVQLFNSFAKNRDLVRVENHNNIRNNSAHNSIVGEIQNRSAHLLAIRSDIATKGLFIESLIQKVKDAAYLDIEEVVTFVDWLDSQLSSLADEQAVLKHFKWPEKKADALREAAIEYRNMKLVESEVSSYKDDFDVHCGVALKKMAGLLDKSERNTERLIKLRNSVMRSYRDHKIPTDWMLDTGIVYKIKNASAMLAKIYVKRISGELESIQYLERESTHEALLVQGINFAYRAHQFCGGLDNETLCAFEEIRRRIPVHIQAASRELFV